MAQVEYLRSHGDTSGGAKSWPLFEMQTYKDEGASAREGRAIFRQREIVKIMMPGNSLNIAAALVTDDHRQRWPREYEAFKAGTTVSAEGLPLEEVPWLNRAMVMELKYLNFQTLEQLAEMNDHATQRIGMGGRMLRDRAKAWLDEAAEASLVERLSKDKEENEAKISVLSKQVEELGTICNTLHSQLQELRNAPNPVVGTAPKDMPGGDPGSAQQAEEPGQSALEALESNHPRRKRR